MNTRNDDNKKINEIVSGSKETQKISKKIQQNRNPTDNLDFRFNITLFYKKMRGGGGEKKKKKKKKKIIEISSKKEEHRVNRNKQHSKKSINR